MKVPILSQAWFRRGSAVVIFLAAALLQVFFKDVPWPLEIDSVDNLHTVTAALGSQEIVLGGAKPSPHHSFLTYDGDSFETVDLDFDRAQLGPDTGALLSNFPPAPPAGPGPWHFLTNEQETAASTDGRCRSFVSIEQPGGASGQNEFHLLQRGQPGLNRTGHFEIRTDAAPLIVNVKTEWPEGRESKAIGCHKRLQSGDWFRGVVNHPVQFVVLPHSSLRINVVSLSAAPPWAALTSHYGPRNSALCLPAR